MSRTYTPIQLTRRSWYGMLKRCYDENNNRFYRYGARGIAVCDEWHDFLCFVNDMGIRPHGYQIDRVDNDGNYEPGNCKWVTPTQNARNRNRSVKYMYKGEIRTMMEISEMTGINFKCLYARLIHLKWPLEKAISIKPKLGRNQYETSI